jgi:hypothetical protein
VEDRNQGAKKVDFGVPLIGRQTETLLNEKDFDTRFQARQSLFFGRALSPRSIVDLRQCSAALAFG